MAGFAEQAQVSPKYYKPFDERGEVADKATRNAIARKYARMRVVTLDDQSGWRLKTCPAGQTLAAWGTDDSQWEAADSSALTPGSVDNSLLATDVKVGSLAALRAAWGTVAKAYASVQDFLDNLLSRTATLETKTSTLSGTNTGDQDISGIAANATALNAHKADLANPHAVTATQVGLGNVSNDAQVKRSELGVASGVATLDAGGKVPTTQLPDAVLGALKFKGTYNFAANRISSPDSALNNAALPLASASNLGFYFIVLDSGVLNSKIYNTGDWLLSNGTAGWTCIDNTDAVSMVAGRIGNVVLSTDDVPEKATTPANLYFTPVRTTDAVGTGLGISKTGSVVTHANETAFGGIVRSTSVQATMSGSYTPDFSASNYFEVTLTASGTLNNPTNMKGGVYLIRINQDAVGGRTLAFGSAYDFLTGGSPSVYLAPNAVTYLTGFVSAKSPTKFEVPSPIAPPIEGARYTANAVLGKEKTVFVNSGSSAVITLTLPATPSVEWQVYSIRNENSGATVTISGTVDGAASLSIAANGKARIGWNGSTYFTLQ